MMAMSNIYNAIWDHCNKGDIVMLLDGDDSFLGTQVISLFNAVYQIHQAGFVYSKYLTVSANRRFGMGGSSRKIPQQYLKDCRFRSLHGFYTSHLMTFYVDLFLKIDKFDLSY